MEMEIGKSTLDRLVEYIFAELDTYKQAHSDEVERRMIAESRITIAKSALKIVARGGCCQVCDLECADKGRTAACSAFRWNGKGE